MNFHFVQNIIINYLLEFIGLNYGFPLRSRSCLTNNNFKKISM